MKVGFHRICMAFFCMGLHSTSRQFTTTSICCLCAHSGAPTNVPPQYKEPYRLDTFGHGLDIALAMAAPEPCSGHKCESECAMCVNGTTVAASDCSLRFIRHFHRPRPLWEGTPEHGANLSMHSGKQNKADCALGHTCLPGGAQTLSDCNLSAVSPPSAESRQREHGCLTQGEDNLTAKAVSVSSDSMVPGMFEAHVNPNQRHIHSRNGDLIKAGALSGARTGSCAMAVTPRTTGHARRL